jgi:uncharacterized protein YjbJ (UPF0337 family)
MRYILTIKREWSELKGKLKDKYKNLTDRDVEFEKGKYEEMMANLQMKLDKTRQELIKILNSL